MFIKYLALLFQLHLTTTTTIRTKEKNEKSLSCTVSKKLNVIKGCYKQVSSKQEQKHSNILL